MGYESKIFIVRKCGFRGGCGKIYAQELARFDLCKVYGVSDYLRNAPKTDCYIYSDDGNTEIIEDRYGKELTECAPEKLIDLIEKDILNDGEYWRYNLILATLREVEKLKDPQIYCLHYGY